MGARATAPAEAASRLAAAHRDLVADPTVQFHMEPVPPPEKMPDWLEHVLDWVGRAVRPIGRFLAWMGHFLPDAPYARILLWGVIALLGVALLWMAVDRIRYGVWRLPTLPRRRSTAVAADDMDEWTPPAAPMREWLAEADELAGAGRYAEAVHHLLFRSVEDIGKRRPQAVRPASTSRELANASAIPPGVRDLFARIARLVERSLFGGRPVDAEDWQAARTAYADLVQPRTWRHAQPENGLHHAQPAAGLRHA